MPRNGSGSYSLPEAAFVPNTPISSAAVNSDLSDVGDALTGSLARDGQGGMTAVLPLANTGFSYLTDPNTGMRRTAADTQAISAGGIDILTVSSTLATITGDLNVTGTFKIAGTAAFPITTAQITDSNVTYAKIQNVTTNRLLGNVSGAPAAPQEITIGTGLLVSGTTVSAPAFPPSGLFKNLSIKVGSNVTIAVAADLVTTTDGTTYQTTALSQTVNVSTTGANSLDTGSVAAASWYSIWAIAKPDGTTGGLASLSATSPTMPSGYTYKARIGWVRTAPAVAQLMGTWQLGRRAQYVVGLAQTTNSAALQMGSVASSSFTAVSTSVFVPSTASEIYTWFTSNTPTGSSQVAPNASYTSAQAPLFSGGATNQNPSAYGNLMLESTNIYAAQSSGTIVIYCNGWVDNI